MPLKKGDRSVFPADEKSIFLREKQESTSLGADSFGRSDVAPDRVAPRTLCESTGGGGRGWGSGI